MKKVKIAIVGAGSIGQGIAEVAARSQMEVFLREKYPEQLERGIAGIEKSLDDEIRKWGLTESEKRSIMSRIHTTADDSPLRDADFIIEAIEENMQDKAKLFRKLQRVAAEETIFITNTALLSITELASHTERPDRVMGMRFLHPVARIKVVELVRGFATSDETYNRVKNLAAALGKKSVEVFEYPGYITTRVIIPFVNEAMYLLLEGVASTEDIDTAISLGFNMECGPLRLADRIGLDIIMTWMEMLFHELGDIRYRPCPLLRKMVRAGHLGRKSGKGFYDYPEDEKHQRPRPVGKK